VGIELVEGEGQTIGVIIADPNQCNQVQTP
jgi:hypothetical protein